MGGGRSPAVRSEWGSGPVSLDGKQKAPVIDQGLYYGAGDEARTRALSLGISDAWLVKGTLTCGFGLARWMALGLWEPYLTAVVCSAGHGWGTRGALRGVLRFGRAGWSEGDDVDLVALEVGPVVAARGQQGDRFGRRSATSGTMVSMAYLCPCAPALPPPWPPAR